MLLVTDIASSEANSYVTITEADDYLSTRPGIDTTEWSNLDDDNKAFRLAMATKLMNSLMYRGIKATRDQSLSFPRLFQASNLWPKDSLGKPISMCFYGYETWDDLLQVANYLGIDPPTIPTDIKHAQIEIAFNVVHNKILKKEDDSPFFVNWLQMGAVAFTVKNVADIRKPAYTIFNNEALNASSPIYFLLKPYLCVVKGGIV